MADQVTTPRKKRLPFKQTIFKKSSEKLPSTADHGADEDPEDDLGLFRRRDEMAQRLKEDQERRWRKKQRHLQEQRRKEREEEQRKEEQRRLFEEEEGNDDEDEEDVQLPDGNTTSGAAGATSGMSFQAEDLTLSSSPSSKRVKLSSASSERHSVTSPGHYTPGTSFQSITQTSQEAHISQKPSVISIDSDSDSEEERRKRSEILSPAVDSPIQFLSDGDGNAPDKNNEDDEDDDDDPGARWEKLAEERQRSQGQNQEQSNADIMVTSSLPNTKPARFKFLFHKPLKVVRDSWYALQRQKGVHMPVTVDEMVLTWKKKKVYMTDTLNVLGAQPQHQVGRGGVALIHMEAWSPQTFQEMQTRESVLQRQRSGVMSDDDDNDDGNVGDGNEGSQAPEAEEDVPKLRVILRAKDLAEVKLTVRQETTVESLLTGYRRQSDVAADKTLSLWFDGEQLDEHVTMEEAEIDDLDTFEVHIR